jgi:hypothetical protein
MRKAADDLGANEDAMVLTKELYDKHLAECHGRSMSEWYCDVEDQPCGPEMIGTRWLVVVDYHS